MEFTFWNWFCIIVGVLIYVSIVLFIAYYRVTHDKRIKLIFENEDELRQMIWDAFLESYMQDEQWHDTDTVTLIVKKLKGESEIKYAKASNHENRIL